MLLCSSCAGELELSECKDAGVLQDTLLYSGREDISSSSSKKKRLQAMHKQKSLDISNTDSILYNLDEHRRKSCIERCDLQNQPCASSSAARQQQHRALHHGKEDSSNGHSIMERRGSGAQADSTRPVIPEVRLSCMETFEDKASGLDSPMTPPGVSALDKEDPDLIDLSSDCTSIPEKRSILSLSDSDSLVFEPLPPLRIVESNEDLFEALTLPGGVLSKSQNASGVQHCSPQHSNTLEVSDSSAHMMTLKQKRDLFRKTSHMPNASLDESGTHTHTLEDGSSVSVLLHIPVDVLESLDPLNADEDEAEDRDSEPKPEDESDEAEFRIQIVPRQRKERKIAVSAIQREYLDISFNTLDKMRDPAAEAGL